QQVDAFVTKFNPQGTNIVYSTYLGGSGSDTAAAIAIDPKGDAYVTGQTNSPDFPTPPHALQAHLFGTDFDSFVAKLNGNGTALVYATYLGQTAADKTHGIAVDTQGNAFVVGETNGGIPRTIGVPQPISGGGVDAFVSKLSARGVLTYSTYLGGVGNDVANGIAVDGRGNAYVAGLTGSASFSTPVFPLRSAIQGTLGGNRGGFGMLDAFVAKVNSCGSGLLYSSYFGGTFVDSATAIAVDAGGNAYVTGSTLSPNFPLTSTLPGGKVYKPASPNAFVAKISGAAQPPRGTCPLPLTLDLSATQLSISAATPLTVTVHTAPFAHIQVALTVKNTVPPPPPPPTPTPVKGKKHAPIKGPSAPKVGQVIYRGQLNGKADAFGLYIGALHPKFVEGTTEVGTLAVHTFASSGVANTSTTVTIAP
ncbi:MAG: SBBP repeat-containing protein, partial [Chloroflexota bacterium]